MLDPIEYQKRVQAKRKAEAAAKRIQEASQETITATATEYDQFQLLLDSLDKDVARLHGLGIDEKNRIRSEELIPKYRPYCRDYQEKGDAYKNPVMVQFLIWLFDVGQIHEALFWAYFAIEQKQSLPERFKRKDLTTFVADAVLEWCELQENNDGSIEPYFSQVFQRLIDDNWPMPDALRSKYFKKAGDLARDMGKPQQALEHYQRAVQLDLSGAKCKTRINQVKKELEKQNESEDLPAGTDGE
ncbi:phage terminase small subunit [Endozoicomonas sp. GU-1]|uniref:phage terminase small subunit n=1 Tax=Endozoicomonas sp. GU-1 TaxID=3009078 RepID=UPI0022B5569B|nr:phage terminase small subunit [Endozoicomonas sp. GU-1]WBA86517.1 phage terminase small subunit [Endozoicomonas sp. GU-1]